MKRFAAVFCCFLVVVMFLICSFPASADGYSNAFNTGVMNARIPFSAMQYTWDQVGGIFGTPFVFSTDFPGGTPFQRNLTQIYSGGYSLSLISKLIYRETNPTFHSGNATLSIERPIQNDVTHTCTVDFFCPYVCGTADDLFDAFTSLRFHASMDVVIDAMSLSFYAMRTERHLYSDDLNTAVIPVDYTSSPEVHYASYGYSDNFSFVLSSDDSLSFANLPLQSDAGALLPFLRASSLWYYQSSYALSDDLPREITLYNVRISVTFRVTGSSSGFLTYFDYEYFPIDLTYTDGYFIQYGDLNVYDGEEPNGFMALAVMADAFMSYRIGIVRIADLFAIVLTLTVIVVLVRLRV